jgi:hypothetical protein
MTPTSKTTPQPKVDTQHSPQLEKIELKSDP